MSKRPYKYLDYIKVLVSISILIFLAVYFILNRGMISSLGIIDCLLFSGLILSFYFTLSIPFKLMLVDSISMRSIFGLSLISNFFNLIIPLRGGTLIRASILKNKYGVTIRKYSSISLLLSICSIFILGNLSLLVISNTTLRESSYNASLNIAAILLSSSSFIFLISSKWISLKIKKNYLIDVFSFKNILITILTYLVAVSLYILRYILIFKVFNIELEIFSIATITVLHLAAGLFSILPGNLGLKELSFVGITSLFEVPASISLVMISFDRILQVILLSFGSSLSMSNVGLNFSKFLTFKR